MKAVLLVGSLLLLTACDFVESVARRGGPAFADAQTVAMDTAGVVARRVSAAFPGELDPSYISMLPDGQSGVTVDWETGDLALYDLTTGAVARLTHNTEPYFPGYADEVSVSPDGRRVAYSWDVDAPEPNPFHLRLLEIGSESPPGVLFEGRGAGWIDPRGWSPDGESLAVVIMNEESEWRIATLDVASGAVRTVRSMDWRAPGRVEYSPDGRFLAYDHHTSADDDTRDVYVVDLATNREHELVASPADDRLVGWLPGSGELLFQSDRSGTNGVWAQRVEAGRPVEDPVLIHADLWQAEPRGLTPDGRLFFSVQADGFQTMVGDIDPAGGVLRNVRPLLPGFAPGNFFPHFRWSWDGSSVGVITQRAPGRQFVLVVRSEATGEVREYPLPPQVGYPGWPSFARDGSAVSMAARLVGGGLPFTTDSDWNAIVRLDLVTGRTEIDHVLHAGAQILPDGRNFLVGRSEPLRRTLDQPFVRTVYVRDPAADTERMLYRLENGSGSWITPDGLQALTLRHIEPGGPREGLLVPLDGSAAPTQLAPPLLFPASGEIRFDPAGDAVVAIFNEAVRDSTGARPDATPEGLTLERIPLDGSERTTTTVTFPSEWPAVVIGLTSGGPVVSPDVDRVLYGGGSPAFELWVLEGLSGTPETRAEDR
jgi:hypothetical protein